MLRSVAIGLLVPWLLAPPAGEGGSSGSAKKEPSAGSRDGGMPSDPKTGPGGARLPGAAEPPPDLGASLKRTGPASWELSVDEAHLLVASLPFMATQLWVRQVRREGRLVGYKLKHIRDGSLVHRAGFRNGDIVRRVNGEDLAHPMKILFRLLDTKRVVVELDRGGEVLEQSYTFVTIKPVDSPR